MAPLDERRDELKVAVGVQLASGAEAVGGLGERNDHPGNLGETGQPGQPCPFPLVRQHGIRNGADKPVTELRRSSVRSGEIHVCGDQVRQA